MDKIRVLRVYEFTGDRDVVEKTIARSINGTLNVEHGKMTIRAATIGSFPEILKSETEQNIERFVEP